MRITLIESGTLESYEYAAYRYDDRHLYRIRVTGPISLKQRLPLYRKILSINTNDTIFCVVDNSAGHENQFTFDDIRYLDDLLLEAGIRYFFGATVTQDAGYSSLVELANTNAKHIQLGGALIAAVSAEEAEDFILSRIREFGPTALGSAAEG